MNSSTPSPGERTGSANPFECPAGPARVELATELEHRDVFHLEGQLLARDLARAQRLVRRWKRVFWMVVGVLLVVYTAQGLWHAYTLDPTFQTAGSRRYIFLALIAGISGLFMFLVWVYQKVQVGRMSRLQAGIFAPITMKISPEGIHCDATLVRSDFRWEAFRGLLADEHVAAILLAHSNQFLIVPRSLLHANEQWPALVRLLQRMVAQPGRATRIR